MNLHIYLTPLFWFSCLRFNDLFRKTFLSYFVCVVYVCADFFILLSMQSFVGISLLKSKIDAAQTQIQTLFALTL